MNYEFWVVGCGFLVGVMSYEEWAVIGILERKIEPAGGLGRKGGWAIAQLRSTSRNPNIKI